ncbi:hypothetical protein HanIR_Chr02g0096201 [Helianthus annuus]|nr:hypothetical protein HanIR_Chr02g0096201 [Helianthus annuus]
MAVGSGVETLVEFAEPIQSFRAWVGTEWVVDPDQTAWAPAPGPNDWVVVVDHAQGKPTVDLDQDLDVDPFDYYSVAYENLA